MKLTTSVLGMLILIAGTVFGGSGKVCAQNNPQIISQPTGLTNSPGTSATFNVAVTGVTPFNYQWQFDGTNLTNNVIATVVGTNSFGNTGDGGAATNARLDSPFGVAFDAAGNLYFADSGNNRVREVNTNGIIMTVAGSGGSGFSGDGGPATEARLTNPAGVAIDTAGNLYISDSNNQRVRKVGTNGIITTFAGNGPGGNVGNGIAATNATLGSPLGLAFDVSGNLYIADYGASRIWMVNTNGIITTVAGNGNRSYSGDGGSATNAGLRFPIGLAFDTCGNLYIADAGNNRIRMVNANGIINTVAGNGTNTYSGDGGASTNASLSNPAGLALDSSGNLYIADELNNRIRVVTTNGIISTLAGKSSVGLYYGDGGPASNANLNYPYGIAFDNSGDLFFSDSKNNCIREILLASGYPSLTLTSVTVTNAGDYLVVITNSYGSVTSAVATLTVTAPPAISVPPGSLFAGLGNSASFSVSALGSGPFDYAWYFDGTNLLQSGSSSTLFLTNISGANAGAYQVIITNNYGSVTSLMATLTVGLPPTISSQPISLTNLVGTTATFSVLPGGSGPFNYQWQFNGTNLPNGIITTVAGNGAKGFSGDGVTATNTSLYQPTGVAFDSFGNFYIADRENQRIRMVNTNGFINTVAGNGFTNFAGDGGLAVDASLDNPTGVALDGSGNLYIADWSNNRIRMVSTNGIITTVAGKRGMGFTGDGGPATNALLAGPFGVALDSKNNLYIADEYNDCIRKVDTNGIITTVTGRPLALEPLGDGGPATNALLFIPNGVAADTLGQLYIADSGNDRIRMVDTNGIITTKAGTNAYAYFGDDGPATNAALYLPGSVALDSYGSFYIPDSGNNRIRKVDTSGYITTVAGNGTTNYSGDGGAAINASLNYPMGVAVDGNGNLLIADYGDNRIRKVLLSAGHPVYTLSNTSTNNAGNYSVVVSSPYGSVTSSVVTLTVTLPPQIIASGNNFGIMGSQFGFNVSGTAAQTIIVQASTNLVDWTPLSTNILEDGLIYFSDPATTNFPWRFYRAMSP